ncbi:hypothetical protein E4U42_007564 [Claviceps africana]|uniref:Uncharacterized protein n=1 Tax=Claviceps africana TaxID=83212 RepID=A0A8K0NG43_9HYPO|nr:hypothetical protein E4U42_007564 [Claviceps africana]
MHQHQHQHQHHDPQFLSPVHAPRSTLHDPRSTTHHGTPRHVELSPRRLLIHVDVSDVVSAGLDNDDAAHVEPQIPSALGDATAAFGSTARPP